MANTYQYGTIGVAANVQHGRRGGFFEWDSVNGVFQVFEPDGTTLSNLRVNPVPVDPSDATSKTYVDMAIQGLSPKESVRLASTAAGTLASDFENGDVLDGVALVTGDRILIKDQVVSSENGIYTVNATGAPTRALDADSSADLASAFCFIEEGLTQQDVGWVTTFGVTDVIGVSNVDWVQFSAANSYTANDGARIIGQNISLDINALNGTVASVPNDTIVFYDASATVHRKRTFDDMLSDQLIMKTDGSTSLTGDLNISGDIIPTTNNFYDIGSPTFTFNTIYGQATSALYADLAEKYKADDDYPEGTVLIIGGQAEVTVTDKPMHHAVAGIVSLKPAFMMNHNQQNEGDKLSPFVALAGRVPCRVTGKINKGDRLGTSQIKGVAMSLETGHPVAAGSVVGIAMEKHEGSEGVIEVMVRSS